MRKFAWGVLVALALVAAVIVPAVLYLNTRLSDGSDWIGRLHGDLKAEMGPPVPSFTESEVWFRDVSVLGFPLATKGVRVEFEKDTTQPDGLGVAQDATPYWIFFDFFYLNMVYEPGYRSGVFCFAGGARRFRCDFWI